MVLSSSVGRDGPANHVMSGIWAETERHIE